jgi:protocatechuate 3,4-dioxygenase beta subunit
MCFSKFKSWVAGLLVLALVGCGGGGGGDSALGNGAGSPVLGGGGTSGGVGGPTLSISLSSPNVTAQAPATITATVRTATGTPVAGSVVSFSLARNDLGTLAADSGLTNAQGMATVGLLAAASGLTGADTITVTVNLGTTTLTGKAGFSVSGAAASLQAMIDNTTLRVSAGPVGFSARVMDASGAPLQGQVVSFASSTGVVAIANPSALTNAAGIAATTATPASGSVGAADTVIASTVVNGRTIQSTLNVQVISETPSIALTLSRSQIGSTQPSTLQATVRDATGLPVTDAVVSFSTQFNLGTFSASTAATAAGSGVATVVLSPRTPTSAGADVVVASVTVNGATRTAQRIVEFVGAVSASPPQLTVSLSSPTVTPLTPAGVTVSLIDGAGRPVVGAVVTLSTSRGNLGALSATSVLTGAQGTATAQLSSAASGIAGADELVATVTLQGQNLQSVAGFTVDASSPTLSFNGFGAGVVLPLRHSTGAAPVTFVVRSATGQALANRVVNFATDPLLATLSGSSAVTNASGIATITARALNASITGAAVITASSVVDGRNLQSTVNLPLLAEAPSLALNVVPAVGSSVISTTAPATVRATVRDSTGALVPNALVSFASQGGLGVFDLPTSATLANGEASVKLSPATASTAGADLITATVTVAGVVVSDQAVVQFTQTSTSVRAPVLTLELLGSNGAAASTVSSANPLTVRATLKSSSDVPVPGQVVTFSVARDLARTNVVTALTNQDGQAFAQLSPTTSSVAGADELTAAVSVAGTNLTAVRGFQIQATDVGISSFGPATNLSAYGQTTLTLQLTGVSIGSPVTLNISSACASQGKATLSPATVSTTTSTVTVQFRDNGCGAVQTTDQIQAVIAGTAVSRSVAIGLTRPDVSSVAFIRAVPEAIFLKGSGFAETSVVRFQVRDGAGNPLPNQAVSLVLLTGAGGVTVQNNNGVSVAVGTVIERATDADGFVDIRVNSGTQPTPVRIEASIAGGIKTVSSNLSVGVGLPSQRNFSLSQQTKNIEGMNIDGTPNTYTIIAADRSGNPVPAGTSINFITEGGQIESIRQTSLVAGIARTNAAFVSADPRPEDGRVTVTAYALGEESFIDQNGNNVYDVGEPFQDLGNIFKDRAFNGIFVPSTDETVPTNIANGAACRPASAAAGASVLTNALLALDPSVPSAAGSCDGEWSGAGRVYVRRAAETVLSTSAARMLWLDTSGLGASCGRITLQTGTEPTMVTNFAPVGGDTYYFGGPSGSLSILVGDANTYRAGSPFAVAGASGRLNPMAAGTTVSATTPTTGLIVRVGGGTPVPNSSEATAAIIGVTFDTTDRGTVFITATSPSGLATTYAVNVRSEVKPAIGVCAP